MRKQADKLKKAITAHLKSFKKYAALKRPRMMIVELSFLYEYAFRYGEPDAYKKWLRGKNFSFTIKNMINNCFDCAEDVETEDIFYFQNPFSQILTGNFLENNRQFENALECYTNNKFIERLKAARRKPDAFKNWLKTAKNENEKL